MTVANAQMDWLKRVDGLVKKEAIHAPEFPLNDLQNHLRTIFAKPNLNVKLETKGWISPQDVFQGMGVPREMLSIVFTPLKESCFFVSSAQDLKYLMSELLGGERAAAPFFDSSQMSGFFHYLGLEVLSFCDSHRFAENLSPRLAEAKTPEHFKSSCFAIDVILSLTTGTFSGRLLLPEPFVSEWNSFYATLPPRPLSQAEREKISVEIAFEMGVAKLQLEEWKSVRVGDCVFLERASFDSAGKGRVVLTLGSEPIFRGKLSADGIKLLEYPIYEEVKESMSAEELDLYGDIDEEGGPSEKAQAAPSRELVSFEKIPILLTVEAGRITMTVEELSKLSPGSILDLKLHPEQGVDLIINGKKVGRGELVKIGEAVGVRITQL